MQDLIITACLQILVKSDINPVSFSVNLDLMLQPKTFCPHPNLKSKKMDMPVRPALIPFLFAGQEISRHCANNLVQILSLLIVILLNIKVLTLC